MKLIIFIQQHMFLTQLSCYYRRDNIWAVVSELCLYKIKQPSTNQSIIYQWCQVTAQLSITLIVGGAMARYLSPLWYVMDSWPMIIAPPKGSGTAVMIQPHTSQINFFFADFMNIHKQLYWSVQSELTGNNHWGLSFDVLLLPRTLTELLLL